MQSLSKMQGALKKVAQRNGKKIEMYHLLHSAWEIRIFLVLKI